MSTISKDITFINGKFQELELFAHTARAWDIDFFQLDRGEFRADLTRFISGNLQFGTTRINRKIQQRGSAPEKLWSFALLKNPSIQLNWRGHNLSPNDIMLYHPGSEIDCISNQDFSVLVYSAPEEYLYNISRMSGFPEIPDLIRTSDRFTCDPAEIQNLRRQLNRISKTLFVSETKSDCRMFLPELEYNIPKLFFKTLAGGRVENSLPSFRLRNYALKQALVCIETSVGDNLTVHGLCQMSGVSDRTLEYAFQEHFGITPKAYIRAYRLNCTRKILLRADSSDTKINTIANSFGFWHMGQFAKDYKHYFGELPSVTLKKS